MKEVALWIVLAIGFCAPTLLGWYNAHPSLHFDLYGMLWLTGMNEYLLGSSHMMTSWPLGQDNLQLDSRLLLWLAHLCQAEQSPYLFLYCIAISGTALSAASASKLAQKVFSIPVRWSIIAGILYGFQALYTVSILEGHLYLLWTFWLPLGWISLDQLRKRPRISMTLCAIVCWIASLFTSAYIGICCTLLYILYGLFYYKDWNKHLTATACILFGVGLFYSLLFSGVHTISHHFDNLSNTPPDPVSTLEEIHAGSSTLSNLVVWSKETDLFYHSLAPTLGWMGICALIFGPLLLSGKKWRFAWVLSIVALLLSFGPFLSLTLEHPLIPWFLYPVLSTPLGSLFHFPIRFLFLTSLGTAILISLLFHQLYQRAPKRILLLGAACFLETFLINGLPLRQGHTQWNVPDIYAETDPNFAVFDLLPHLHDQHLVEPLRVKNLICSYQIEHKRKLVNECLGKHPTGKLEEFLREELFHGKQSYPWNEILIQLGIGSLILHVDLWPPEKQSYIKERLRSLFGPPTSVTTNGEHLLLWTLPVSANDVNIEAGLQRIGFK